MHTLDRRDVAWYIIFGMTLRSHPWGDCLNEPARASVHSRVLSSLWCGLCFVLRCMC